MSTAIIHQPVPQSTTFVSLAIKLTTRWHLLSLDAPTVAIAWLFCLNRDAALHDLVRESIALGTAVWMIYVLDRLVDATRSRERLQDRHHFHLLHRRMFSIGLLLAAIVLALLVPWLPSRVRDAWCLLALPLLLYAVLVHLLDSRFRKEVLVGVFFAVAVTAPTWTTATWKHVVPEAMMFCSLCWWNCFAITQWEESLRTQRRVSVPFLLPFVFLASFALCAGSGTPSPVLAAAAGSACLLLFMDTQRQRLAPLLLRSVADAALLTPLLVLPLLHGR